MAPVQYVNGNIINLSDAIASVNKGLEYVTSTDALQIAEIVFIFATVLIQAYLIYHVYMDLGYLMFHTEGASILKRNIYQRYQSYLTLLKMSTFFSITVTMQLLSAFYQCKYSSNAEDLYIKVLICLILIALSSAFFYLFGIIGIRKCWKSCIVLSLICILIDVATLGYELYLMNSKSGILLNSQWITSVSGAKLCVDTLLFVNGMYCLLDINRGLKEIIQKPKGVAPERTRILID